VAVYFREDAGVLGTGGGAPRPEGDVHDALRAALARSAEFWGDLLGATGLEAEQALPALWDLVWAGEVTNDAWQPLRAPRRYGTPKAERRPRRFARRRAVLPTATQGRWSTTDSLFETGPVPGTGQGPSRRALAELLLERQGIVTRDGVRAEGIPGGYGAVYAELRALETLGLCRRGYFVQGLGGAQFALGGAVERLRELRPREGEEPQPLVLAAADPAQPYGASLPWPKRAAGRAARVAGAQVVLLGGEAGLFVERGGKTLLPLREPEDDWLPVALSALVEHTRRAGRGRRLAVERFDGEPVVESAVMPLLVEAGFVAGPRRAVLRP
jgi:ATP-dependent Lhr-like helicase